LVKKAKSRLDTTRVASWNRLLRSRRVLVLPAHVNITVITNSFDVVHSWHIPGLGLKMDCLPGRATHHTLYIDNVGLYYGQCAEICGRYHHHMPIRVCALPFEHFLVWWHTFGLPKFLFPSDESKVKLPVSKYFTRKFSW
jgi:heme/copper-type cytochrome/quinol oxidase subunit 2